MNLTSDFRTGDGGIHGQVLRNNGFQGDSPDLTAYSAVGSAELSVDTDNPLSTAITRSLKVAIASGTTGQVGFSNSGYLGVPVNADSKYFLFFSGPGVHLIFVLPSRPKDINRILRLVS